jgi:putative toxin-antitoxin system antitoxin component (TIGR02293 family)
MSRNITYYKTSYGSITDRDTLNLIAITRNGISYGVFVGVMKKTPFSLIEWSNFLNMSLRTMQRYQKKKKTFDSIYAQRILEINLVYNQGVELFGNTENFDTWLDTKSIALGGIKPKELLDNTFGIELLKTELGRIEYGILA